MSEHKNVVYLKGDSLACKGLNEYLHTEGVVCKQRVIISAC